MTTYFQVFDPWKLVFKSSFTCITVLHDFLGDNYLGADTWKVLDLVVYFGVLMIDERYLISSQITSDSTEPRFEYMSLAFRTRNQRLCQ